MADYFGKETPKLGFGLMRLPKRGAIIDTKQTSQMVDMFLEAGFTYFDTAYVYLGSEAAAKRALVDRHPRESFTLATKVNASVAPTEKAARKQFDTSLKRTGAEYFDYYLLHCLMAKNREKYEKYHLWEHVRQLKEQGLIRHVGFSFHDGPEVLDSLLTEHPEVEFVQLQLNYSDWEDPQVTSRANYEVARRHGKSVVVMEPVKGGRLADPPAEVKKLFTDYAPDASPASWAIRFAASLDGILTVLSGMSNVAQMQDNLSFMKAFQPLNDAERQIIAQAQQILGRSAAIPCTGCAYCVEGCPQRIPIPAVFAAANQHLSGGSLEQAKASYRAATEHKGLASACVGCRHCESVCPQHLPITDHLKSCAQLLEK